MSPTPPRPDPAPALASREHLRQAALNRARARGAVVAQRRLAWRWALFLLGRSLLALGLAALLAAALLAGLWQAQWRVVPAQDVVQGVAQGMAPAVLQPAWAQHFPPAWAEFLGALSQAWPWRPLVRPAPAAADATISATPSPTFRSQAP